MDLNMALDSSWSMIELACLPYLCCLYLNTCAKSVNESTFDCHTVSQLIKEVILMQSGECLRACICEVYTHDCSPQTHENCCVLASVAFFKLIRYLISCQSWDRQLLYTTEKYKEKLSCLICMLPLVRLQCTASQSHYHSDNLEICTYSATIIL